MSIWRTAFRLQHPPSARGGLDLKTLSPAYSIRSQRFVSAHNTYSCLSSLPDMHHTLVSSLLVWLWPVLAIASGPTSVFIDSVQAYHLLETCAEEQVSLIVRDMSVSLDALCRTSRT